MYRGRAVPALAAECVPARARTAIADVASPSRRGVLVTGDVKLVVDIFTVLEQALVIARDKGIFVDCFSWSFGNTDRSVVFGRHLFIYLIIVCLSCGLYLHLPGKVSLYDREQRAVLGK